MPDKEHVTLSGAAYPPGRDSEDFDLRFTKAKNTPMTKVRLRVWVKDQEDDDWYNVLVFNEQAENLCESIRKGDRIIVTGQLEKGTWTKPSGEVVDDWTVIADDVGVAMRWATVTVHRPERTEPKATVLETARQLAPAEDPF